MKPRPRSHWNKAHKLRAILAERFPAAITPSKSPTKTPLKVGIHNDLVAACPDLPRRELTRFLSVYTAGEKYNLGLVEGAVRIDLDGNLAGYVTAAQAERATHILAKIAGIRARRAATAEAA